MIASTFWKNTMPLCTGWDQLTACSSLWWSVKLPAVWKNFFGTIGARRRTSASGESLAGLADLAAALEPLARRAAVELDHHVVVDPADPAVVERDQLHRVAPLSFCESSFRISCESACVSSAAPCRRAARPGTPGAAAPAWRSSRRGSAARTARPRRARRPPRRTSRRRGRRPGDAAWRHVRRDPPDRARSAPSKRRPAQIAAARRR